MLERLWSNLKYLLRTLFYPAALGTLFILLLPRITEVQQLTAVDNYAALILVLYTATYAGLKARYERVGRRGFLGFALVLDYFEIVLLFCAYRALGLVPPAPKDIGNFCLIMIVLLFAYIVGREMEAHVANEPGTTWKNILSRNFGSNWPYPALFNWLCLLGIVCFAVEWIGVYVPTGNWPRIDQLFAAYPAVMGSRILLWILVAIYLLCELVTEDLGNSKSIRANKPLDRTEPMASTA